MKKSLLAFTFAAIANTAMAASSITEADVRNATLDDRIVTTLKDDRVFLMAMIKDGLTSCKQRKGTFIAVEYRKDGTIDLGCTLFVTETGKAANDRKFQIHLNSGGVVEIPAMHLARTKATRVYLSVMDEFAPLSAVIKQNNELKTRINALDPGNKESTMTARQRERMIDCVRGFAGEVEQMERISSPFAQNLYEFQERTKSTGDKTTADRLLDPPTPETRRNLDELKSRAAPLTESLNRVDAKFSKCEAKYLK